jgi:outer membrane biosynthesis protein TonB
MTNGLRVSLLLHLVFLVLIIYGLPSLNDDIKHDYAIVTEVVQVSELTNIKMKHADKKDKVETQSKKAPSSVQEKVEPEAPKEVKKPTKVQNEKAESIPDKNVKPKKQDKSEEKKPEKKKEEKKKEEKKENKIDALFEQAVLKSLEEDQKPKPQKDLDDKFQELEDSFKGETNKEYNPHAALSISEIDAIKSQITKNWNTSAFSGADSKGMQVIVHIVLDNSANVISVTPIGANNNSPYYQAFVASCIRAVKAASPLQHLSPEKYQIWKEIEFRFDSSGMIY